ncbi:MAG: hypothetical protein H6712_13360 [Myxococcales bacterium]|nr:hypothetical protein [Myxococcales bacterium]MCB9714849.1 hypothetical protein [Myxococcales bacterium]
MDDLRFARLMGRNAVEDVELRRLFDHKERLLALLRASRSPEPVSVPVPEPAPIRFRSRYAASLWALAHGESSEPASAA